MLSELGGHGGQDGRRTEFGGDTPNRPLNQVCGRPGGRGSAAVPSGGHLQQHPSPGLPQFPPGRAVRREHPAPGRGRGRVKVLGVQQKRAGERLRPLQQRLLHPERLPPVTQLRRGTGRQAARPVSKRLRPLSLTADAVPVKAFGNKTVSKAERPAGRTSFYTTEQRKGQCFVESFIYANTYMNKAP